MKRKRRNNIRKVGADFALTIPLGVASTPEAEPCTSVPEAGEKVFKFQRPLSTSGGTLPPGYPPILAYNQDRSVETQLHVSTEIEILFGPDDVKAYAVCVIENGIPVPIRRVAAQPW